MDNDGLHRPPLRSAISWWKHGIEGDWADFPNVYDLAPLQVLSIWGYATATVTTRMICSGIDGIPEEQIPISEHHHFEKYPEIFMFNVR